MYKYISIFVYIESEGVWTPKTSKENKIRSNLKYSYLGRKH